MLELFVFILVIVYAVTPDPTVLGVADSCMWKCLCYPLAHASWLHLFMNCFALLLMSRALWRVYYARFGYLSFTKFFLYCYVGAVISALPTAGDIPTVGASGIIYFMLGILLALRPTLAQLKNYFWVFAAIVLQFFLGHSNVWLHIVAFVLGFMFVLIHIAYDDRRIH